MIEKIKITKNLKFDYCDLMLSVDMDHEFTLKDVLRIVTHSKVDRGILERILQCPYIFDYWKEVNSKKFQNDSDIEYLEVGLTGEIDKFGGKINSSTCWSFYGLGKKGVIPKDLMENCTKKEIAKMKKDKWQQSYAIEFSPMYKLANYPIKVSDKIVITDWIGHKEKKDIYKNIDIKPTITLLSLLFVVFWELSFCGNIKQRDDRIKELKRRCDEFKKAKAEGRLDEVSIPWSEVKKRIKKTIKEASDKRNKEKKNKEK